MGTSPTALPRLRCRTTAGWLQPTWRRAIRVNAIAVGSTATSALDVVMQDDEMRRQIEAATPLQRLGRPDEIAAAVLYLCSPAGAYLTGKILEVDGGLDRPNLDLGLPDL